MESPPTITADQITTNYVQNLERMLNANDFKGLERHIRDVKCNRAADGKRPLNIHYIHELALKHVSLHLQKSLCMED